MPYLLRLVNWGSHLCIYEYVYIYLYIAPDLYTFTYTDMHSRSGYEPLPHGCESIPHGCEPRH